MAAIGFIGLGNMGGPMAANLAKAGHSVAGYDVSERARTSFAVAAGAGARSAGDIDEAVDGADVVVTMLPAGSHVREVVEGSGGVLANAKHGALLVDCSTIDVASARAVAEAATARGLMMVDAPVSGGVAGAHAATLTFMVGGTQVAFERAEPLLAAMGKTVVHAGDAGAGQSAKICNNMILGVSMIAVSEAFNLADGLGLDRQKLFEISSTASGQCWSLTSYCPVPGPVPTSPANRDYQPGFSAAMMLKDLNLAADAAQSTGTRAEMGAGARALYQAFCEAGGEDVDFSGIVRYMRGDRRPS